jgi:hypothetical protein
MSVARASMRSAVSIDGRDDECGVRARAIVFQAF